MSGDAADPDGEGVLSVHFGRSANCSSIGSVIDVLFVSGVVGTAVLASLAVLLGGRGEPGADDGATARDAGDAAERDAAAGDGAVRASDEGSA